VTGNGYSRAGVMVGWSIDGMKGVKRAFLLSFSSLLSNAFDLQPFILFVTKIYGMTTLRLRPHEVLKPYLQPSLTARIEDIEFGDLRLS